MPSFDDQKKKPNNEGYDTLPCKPLWSRAKVTRVTRVAKVVKVAKVPNVNMQKQRQKKAHLMYQNSTTSKMVISYLGNNANFCSNIVSIFCALLEI